MDLIKDFNIIPPINHLKEKQQVIEVTGHGDIWMYMYKFVKAWGPVLQ